MSKRAAFISPIPEFDMIVKGDILKVHTTVDPFSGSSVTYREPIGLEYIDGFLRRNDYATKTFTETAVNANRMMNDIDTFKPDIIGLSVHSAVVYPDTVSIARRLKAKNPETKIIIGGYHPTGEVIEYSKGNINKTLLHSRDIDFVVYGEGEESFLELSNKILSGENIDGVEGIAYKNGNEIIMNPRRKRVNFSELPWPSRYEDIIKYSRCAPLAYPSPNKQISTAQISGSRGCVYGCDFCSSMTIWPSKKEMGKYDNEATVIYRDPSDVVAEINYLKKEFGTNFLTFTDLTFNHNKEFATDLCNEMISENISQKPKGENDFGWFAYATVDKTVKHPETVETMADAGCSRIGIGLESLHKSILRKHKPNNTMKTEGKSLEIVNSEGILNRSYLIVGWPDETPEMFDETRDILLSGEMPIDQLRLAFVVPFLGTPLFSEYKDRLLTLDWRKYTGDEPVVKNDYMSAEEMKQRTKNTLIDFYSSDNYKKHVERKTKDFPHLKETYRYWEEYLQKREIIPTSYKLLG
ncbi:MAG: B12-binding domain-containing radical SAM protein [Nanoarchaeota archaeon]|nr:B12-binding domain-containing radical SAM protein [Nanoarchaeota archaeon]